MSDTTPTIDPRHAILLVMDYQPAILDNVLGADELLHRMDGAIATVRSGGMRVGYVRVAFEDGDYDAVPETNKGFAAASAVRRMHADAPETSIHDAVAPEARRPDRAQDPRRRVLDDRSGQAAARTRDRHARPRGHLHEWGRPLHRP
jgi:nicotinamidase-related amidase